jgi:ABC-type branched-subunit amino acid transport system permease subunit
VYTNGAIYVTVFVSLALLVRTSGQVSLCHATFVAIGATTFSHLTHGAGLPWLVGLLLAGLVVVPVGALISLPAIRLSGLYLALATFGFAVLVERVVFSTGVMFGTSSALRLGARPGVLGLDSDRGFFYLCALVAVIATLAAAGIRRTRLGRLLRGLADSPVALTTNGANANITRVLVFCASAFIAAVAGGLIVCLNGSVNGAPFNALASLTYLAVLAVAGRSPVGAPVIAALAFVVAPSYFSNPNLASYLQIAFGSAAVLATCFGASFGDWVTARGASTRHRRESTPVRARSLARAGTGA